MHIHILGICGTLMGSIALLARQLGHDVSGSDQNVYPPMSTQLEQAGIKLASGYSASNVPTDADLVIIGNAGLPRGNDAVEAVLDRGMPYMSGAEWLGRYVLADRWVIAIAGTHGKTTTTSMVAHILQEAGMNPGFLIGGVPGNFETSAQLGQAPFFVIEADEYDTSYFDRRSKFLHYRPRTLVLNNLEYDHADIFPDLAAIQNQFHLLLRTVPGSGLVIVPPEDANIHAVLEQGCWTPTITFGTTADGGIEANLLQPDGSEFDVAIEGKSIGNINWPLTGVHNVNNALAAIAASRHAGVGPVHAVEALSSFKGVKRRMEVVLTSNNVTVYDDFAHHPTAIATTLDGLRKKVGDEKILAVIEPGSHTMRLGTHAGNLVPSAETADIVIWYQHPGLNWDLAGEATSSGGKLARSTGDILNLVEQTLDAQQQPLHIVVMSNTGFGGLVPALIRHIQQRHTRQDA